MNPYNFEHTLKSVARSFYLTLRVLPRRLREPIGLAYLLARAADTVADSQAVPSAQRRDALTAFSDALEPCSQCSTPFLWPQADIGGARAGLSPAERELLTATDLLLGRLAALADDDAVAVRNVVRILVQGMQLDLSTFAPENASAVAALERPEELDRYIYLVAGCVGEFWTDMLNLHAPALGRWDVTTQRRWGMEYGKALQLTNVLRDVPRDLRIGRCYLPRAQLQALGLTPEGLLDPRAGPTARELLHHWIQVALVYYSSAARYVLAIPRRCMRLRLAALWPALIGLETLALLAADSNRWLDPTFIIKVRRPRVYRMLALSTPLSLSNTAVQIWFGALEKRVRRALASSEYSSA